MTLGGGGRNPLRLSRLFFCESHQFIRGKGLLEQTQQLSANLQRHAQGISINCTVRQLERNGSRCEVIYLHIGEAGRNCRTAAQPLKNEIGFQGQGLIAPVVSEGVVALFGRIREGKAECTPSFSS